MWWNRAAPIFFGENCDRSITTLTGINSKLKRIENISNTESDGENSENNNNKLNISKEQINKIVK